MPRSSGNRKSRRRQLQASHQKNWLTGRYAILETLRAGKWPVAELFVAAAEFAEEAAESTQIEQLAAAANVQIRYETSERISELCHSTHHQGVAARMGDFPYCSVDWLLDSSQKAAAERRTPIANKLDPPTLIVVCDRIQDSHNFGAILRCCDAMNVKAVVIGDSEQATVTPQVSRSSAGAVNHVPIILTDDLNLFVDGLKSSGLQIAVASETAADPAWTQELTMPLVLIVGSEAHGVSDALLSQCEHHLQIPMLGQVESLNVAVATGILLYEIRRQQLGR